VRLGTVEKNMSQMPRSVTELFYCYLHRQIAVQAAGLGLGDPEGQAIPHDPPSAQALDPQLAWEDALAVMQWSRAGIPPVSPERWEAPPNWPSLVAALEPAFALAFCVGNFPQRVRNVQPLLIGGDVTTLRNERDLPVIVPPALLQWAYAVQSYPQLFMAIGVLRLARRFDEARELLRSKGKTPAAWRALRANEEAALAWHRGDTEQALQRWQTQQTNVPVLFNRGMAALFLGRPAEARLSLEQAVAQLPETSAWHHLGQLYLTLTRK